MKNDCITVCDSNGNSKRFYYENKHQLVYKLSIKDSIRYKSETYKRNTDYINSVVIKNNCKNIGIIPSANNDNSILRHLSSTPHWQPVHQNISNSYSKHLFKKWLQLSVNNDTKALSINNEKKKKKIKISKNYYSNKKKSKKLKRKRKKSSKNKQNNKKNSIIDLKQLNEIKKISKKRREEISSPHTSDTSDTLDTADTDDTYKIPDAPRVIFDKYYSIFNKKNNEKISKNNNNLINCEINCKTINNSALKPIVNKNINESKKSTSPQTSDESSREIFDIFNFDELALKYTLAWEDAELTRRYNSLINSKINFKTIINKNINESKESTSPEDDAPSSHDTSSSHETTDDDETSSESTDDDDDIVVESSDEPVIIKNPVADGLS